MSHIFFVSHKKDVAHFFASFVILCGHQSIHSTTVKDRFDTAYNAMLLPSACLVVYSSPDFKVKNSMCKPVSSSDM